MVAGVAFRTLKDTNLAKPVKTDYKFEALQPGMGIGRYLNDIPHKYRLLPGKVHNFGRE